MDDLVSAVLQLWIEHFERLEDLRFVMCFDAKYTRYSAIFQQGLTCARGRMICLGFWVESTADVSPAPATPLLVLFLIPSKVFLMKLLRLDEVVGLLLLLLLDATTDGVAVELADGGDKLLRLTTVPAGRGAVVTVKPLGMRVDTGKKSIVIQFQG